MTVAYFTGFETGDTSELGVTGGGASIQGTTVRTGGYALKQSTTRSLPFVHGGTTQSICRVYLQVPALPGANTIFLSENTAASASTERLGLRFNTSNNLEVYDIGATLGLPTTAGTAALSTATWYRIELAVDLAAGGIVKVWVDGTLDISTTHSSDVSGATTRGYKLYGAATPNEYFFDDFRFDTGTLTQIGAGATIARQPMTGGTPTYDAWTKSSGTDAGALWDNTPFDTTDFCSSATASQAQTAIVASFGSTQSGHGTETLGSSDTINASKVGMVGKTNNTLTDGGDSFRRRVGGADTDTATTSWGTSNTYRELVAFTGITYTNLTDGTTEMGVIHGTGTRTHTVEDMWWMIDYTPAAAAASSIVMRSNLSPVGTRAGSRQVHWN